MATTSPSPGGVNSNNYRFSGAGVSVFILGRVLCIFGHRIASQRSSAFGRSHSNDGNNRAQKAAQSGPNGIVAANRSFSAFLKCCYKHKHSYTFYLLTVTCDYRCEQAAAARMRKHGARNEKRIL